MTLQLNLSSNELLLVFNSVQYLLYGSQFLSSLSHFPKQDKKIGLASVTFDQLGVIHISGLCCPSAELRGLSLLRGSWGLQCHTAHQHLVHPLGL